MVKFYENNNTNHEDFKKAIEIYTESFPSNERHPPHTIKERVDKGLYRVFVGHLENEVAFMALFWPLRDTDFILFDYMAVKRNYQNKGIGTKFMKSIIDTLGMKDKYLILEVENPDYGDNKEQRKRRVEFYTRHGARKMKNVRYILPPLSGNTPTEMILMVLPEYNGGKIPGMLVKKIIIQIYKELYNRNENDPLLNSFIYEIPSTVELIRE